METANTMGPVMDPEPEFRDFEQEKFAAEEPGRRKAFWITVVVLHLLLFVPEFFVEYVYKFEGKEGVVLYWWHCVMVFEIVFNFASFSTQEQNEVGGILCLGKYLFQSKKGLNYVPVGICRLDKNSSTYDLIEIPKGVLHLYPELLVPNEDGVLPELALRITTKTSKGEGTKDPIDTGRLTLNGTFLVGVQLDDSPGAYRQFYERVGSLDKLIQFIDDMGVGEIRKQVLQKTPTQVLEEISSLEAAAASILQEETSSFGLRKFRFKIKGLDLPRRVNEALADRTAAQVGVETGRLEGERQKEKDLQLAVGNQALQAASLAGVISALEKARSKEGLDLTKDQVLILAQQMLVRDELKNANYSLLNSGDGILNPASIMAMMEEGRKVSQSKTKNPSTTPNERVSEE